MFFANKNHYIVYNFYIINISLKFNLWFSLQIPVPIMDNTLYNMPKGERTKIITMVKSSNKTGTDKRSSSYILDE